MFALVNKEDNSIVRMFNGRKGITIGENQYPQSIFTLWSEAERNEINIYTIEIDESKKKDSKWYINTNINYSFDGSKVTGSYGDATARAHTDVLFTQEDEDNGRGTKDDVKTEGLKTGLIRNIKTQAQSILNETDWYVTRKSEEDIAIPSSITTHRKAVRSKQAEMETAITNASDTPALETLYTYTRQDDGSFTRPLGVIPTLE